MFERLVKSIYLTKGEKAFALACAGVIAMTAGITMLIMSGVEGQSAIQAESSWYALWIVFAGALGGGVALFATRGWLGQSGALGLARAVVGSIALGFIAAIVAGTLILPLFGTFYAPFMLVTEFIDKPWLAVAWFVVLIGAHYMMNVLVEERAQGDGLGVDSRATSQLSKISQANLYQRSSS